MGYFNERSIWDSNNEKQDGGFVKYLLFHVYKSVEPKCPGMCGEAVSALGCVGKEGDWWCNDGNSLLYFMSVY